MNRKANIEPAFPKPKRRKGRGCRVSNRDDAEKQKRGYTDPRSYVRLDGSEVLYGNDWILRKQQLGERSGGRCELIIGGRCRAIADDAHHIIPRSQYRDDSLEALLHVCRWHHQHTDKRQPRWSKRP